MVIVLLSIITSGVTRPWSDDQALDDRFAFVNYSSVDVSVIKYDR